MNKNQTFSILIGAAFLMATSAIGPGFLTQTVLFTDKLKADFAFVILVSIVLDLIAQINIWRIIAVTGKRAQDLANDLRFGLGHFLAFLIVFGGLIFNIGNLAGCGLGTEVLFGLDVKLGATLSSAIAIFIFLQKEAGKAMDAFAKILGILMILLATYIAFIANPPLQEAAFRSVLPQNIDFLAIVTIVGGTVGGYISFAGAHRLLDANISGKENLKEVTKGSVTAILLASVMRVVLFLGALGMVMKGVTIDKNNPAASIFQAAAGGLGYKFFGVVLWAAAITSVIGAAYTSISFLTTLHVFFEKNKNKIVVFFIVFSNLIFVLVGKPVQLLVWAGTINGFVLPLALAILLIAIRQKRIANGYQHPPIMQISGWILVFFMGYMAVKVMLGL